MDSLTKIGVTNTIERYMDGFHEANIIEEMSINDISEKFKISIRNIRSKFIDNVKNFEKDKEISIDESKKFVSDIQNLTDNFISLIDSSSSTKEKEILHI